MSQPPRSQHDPIPPPAWRRPRGVAAGTWAYFNERLIADRYDRFVADTPLCDLDSQLLFKLFPSIQQPTIVLDLGCGSGRTAIPLARRGYRVIGVDLSEPMLSVMIRKASPEDQIIPLRCNLVELGCLSSRSVDHAICMFSTLGMIQGGVNRDEFLRNVARILPPGGQLVVHVHNRWTAFGEPGGIRALAGSWLRSLRSKDHDFGDCIYRYRGLEKMFIHRYSQRELVGQLRKCGFTIQRVHRVSLDGSAFSDSHRIPGGFIAMATSRPPAEKRSD